MYVHVCVFGLNVRDTKLIVVRAHLHSTDATSALFYQLDFSVWCEFSCYVSASNPEGHPQFSSYT